MNKDDDLNSEKMVEKCCSCVGWGLRSGTTKRWARPTLTLDPFPQGCVRPDPLLGWATEFTQRYLENEAVAPASLICVSLCHGIEAMNM